MNKDEIAKIYTYEALYGSYEECRNERSEWESEWREISEFLLPGRGIYQTFTKPRKRKLTSPKVVNPAGEDALYVLTSGVHSSLTSPSRPWFALEWENDQANSNDMLKAWIQNATIQLHRRLHASNFYSMINSFYTEYFGFGTGCTFVGEGEDDTPFHFELLTAGEYAFATGIAGRPSIFFRTIFMTPRKAAEKFCVPK